jgi:subtilisin family serine protease
VKFKRILGALIALTIVFAIFPAIQPQIATRADLKIDPNLINQMHDINGLYKAIVEVAWNPDLEPIKFNHDAVLSTLKAEAARTQAPVIAYLKQKSNVQILNTFWIDDLILIQADQNTIRDVAALSSVKRVLMDFNVMVPKGEISQINSTSSDPATWNIEKVRAPDVWTQLGIHGEGIKFATEDTGVDITCNDLAGTMYTADPSDPTYPGGWSEFDANGNWVSGSVPHDSWVHGTATYGLIVGDATGPYGAIGMAPKAIGMHTLCLPGGGGYWPQVIAGLEWILDPYDAYGNRYPMPRVSSHSWGGTPGYIQDMIAPIRNLYYAGQAVVAAIGNEYEGSTRSPGDVYECFAAGATDSNDNVAIWSSGRMMYKSGWSSPPADWPDQYMKPDVSAPGDNVIVLEPGNQYVYWGGTSFASPHVAGAAVLMLSADPSLTPATVEDTLRSTAVWYNRYYPSPPDDRYGWGRIDAFEATQQVALKQGIVGTVTDATTGLPLSGAKVTAGGRTVSTDANGNYKLRLEPGTYDVTFTCWGYYDKTVTNVVVNANVFTTLNAALTLIPPGYVAGHVYFQPSGIGIPGALVEAVGTPRPVQALTDVDGSYVMTIPPGTYDFKASCYQFKTVTQTSVSVSQGQTTTLDFNLVQPPSVAVVGDYNNIITTFLSQKGYSVASYNTIEGVIPDIPKYQTIVVNWPGYWENVYENVFDDFVSATDQYGVGVVWLDQSYSYYQTGGWLLNQYLHTPDGYTFPYYRYDYNYAYYADYTYYKVYPTTDSDLLPGYNVGDKVIHTKTSTYKMYLWYYDERIDPSGTGYIPGVGTVKDVATVGYYYYGDNDYQYYNYYHGIMKVTRDTGNKWVILPLHATNYYESASDWTDETTTLFLNSLTWTAAAAKPHPKFCLWNLTAAPTVGLWYTPRTVSVGIKNVWVSGITTVQVFINGVFETQTDVSLGLGVSEYLTWNVTRFDVGTYTVIVRNLATKFIVRAPVKSVQAYQYNSNTPLAGADVYGYYRTYMGPGWHTQWSYTYGGYGHSQFAQPVGDLDGDGMNEVIVGGYETTITPGYCHILRYNAKTGSYDNLYTWNSGGSSPSGASICDLNGDGKKELVVSWGYGNSPGVYAYTWDGKKLTQLDYYYASFVFDVYTCDPDKDGDTDIVVSNAPWGGTPYHVFILDWDKANNKFVFDGGWTCPLDPYFSMETSMSWSGDIYGDGNIEIVSLVSSGGSSTAGIWALIYDGATLSGTQIYASPLTTGTPYGICVGYVKGDGIPEIGIGNNNPSYVGAEACLLKYNTGTHAFDRVWDGTWATDYSIIESVAIGDADNDGKNEFVAGRHIMGWTGSTYAEKATLTEPTGMFSGAIIGDMDTDGKNELKLCDIIGYGPGDEWIFKYSSAPTPGTSWTFKKFGTTDTNGQLAFDSPASIVDMYLFIYKDPSTNTLCWPPKHVKGAYDYLLTKYDYIADDMSNTYKPATATEALVIAKPDAPDLWEIPHEGIVWIQKQASTGPLQGSLLPILWPFTCNVTNPANVVMTPETYIFRHMLNEIDQFGSWWYYFMAPDQVTSLKAKQTYSYKFAGPIQGFVKHSQTGTSVRIDWNANDSSGHQITGISLEETNWLTTGTTTYIPVPVQPSMLTDVKTLVGQTTNYYPLVVLYDKYQNMISSGYITWDQKPAYTTVASGVTVSYAELDFESGRYGNPWVRMYVTVFVESLRR